MPKSGWNSITISSMTYDEIKSIYTHNKKTLTKHGITTLSGFLTTLIYIGLDSKKVQDVINE